MLWGWHLTSVVFFLLRSHSHRIIRKASATSWYRGRLPNGWPLFLKTVRVTQTEANLSNSHIQKKSSVSKLLILYCLKVPKFHFYHILSVELFINISPDWKGKQFFFFFFLLCERLRSWKDKSDWRKIFTNYITYNRLVSRIQK